MKTMDAKAWLQMEALFEVTKEDKPIVIDQSRLIAMLDGYAEYRVKNFDLADVDGSYSAEDMSKAWIEGYHRKVDEINGNELRYFDVWLANYR